jgi:adenosine deaminase
MGTDGIADLHRHLDGSLRLATALELADRLGVAVPSPLEFGPGIGLEGALARFRFTLALLQEPDAVRRVAREMCEDAAREGVTTLEIRFAPQLHRGASLAEVVDAALDGAGGRAGLVLCALYGESPDVLGRLVDCAGPRRGVVGVDLAGGPLPDHSYRLEDYTDPFSDAARAGLGITVHAAEGRSPREIVVAVERLHARRIGHGTTVLDDDEAVAVVRERGVTVEACVTSNLHTGAIAAIEDHPLPRWLDRGLRACVCADNTLFSATTAAEELARVARIPGMDAAKLARVVEQGHAAAFARAPS